ncbi:MAG TPA: hypothetical protein VFO85_18340, partial [Vicinamibacteria bacterium]|nr:hypothetical protein [Vicinamibacteria bacterium]
MPQPIPLRVVTETPALPPPLAADPVTYGAGFHDQEHADGLPFRWMSLRGTVSFAPSPAPRFLE